MNKSSKQTNFLGLSDPLPTPSREELQRLISFCEQKVSSTPPFTNFAISTVKDETAKQQQLRQAISNEPRIDN